MCFAWALMDISYYSIGLFTPDILSALHLNSSGNFITDTKSIVENTIFLNAFVALGAFISIFVIDKVPRIGLQKIGFLGTIFLPQFQHLFGIHITMFVLSFTLLLGYLFTTLLKGYPLSVDIPIRDVSEKSALINEY